MAINQTAITIGLFPESERRASFLSFDNLCVGCVTGRFVWFLVTTVRLSSAVPRNIRSNKYAYSEQKYEVCESLL
jgi:hypothetical protein